MAKQAKQTQTSEASESKPAKRARRDRGAYRVTTEKPTCPKHEVECEHMGTQGVIRYWACPVEGCGFRDQTYRRLPDRREAA